MYASPNLSLPLLAFPVPPFCHSGHFSHGHSGHVCLPKLVFAIAGLSCPPLLPFWPLLPWPFWPCMPPQTCLCHCWPFLSPPSAILATSPMAILAMYASPNLSLPLLAFPVPPFCHSGHFSH